MQVSCRLSLIQLSTILSYLSHSREFCFQEENPKLIKRQITKQSHQDWNHRQRKETVKCFAASQGHNDITNFRLKQFPKRPTHPSLKHNEHEKFTIEGWQCSYERNNCLLVFCWSRKNTIYNAPVFAANRTGVKPRIQNKNTYCFQTWDLCG